ncbi:MAG: hypothetical protein BWZ02_01922 [Lentisphaerae bacterium ADurb.BinA184]|nr:MAG: hypothetical protein BWZ02_01922 [Lentisphaerae bacterium ADurb.BinA184]
MKLFRAKVWSVVDIGLLKWCSLLVGLIAGAYLADYVRRYVWIIAAVAVVMAAKVMVSYFCGDGQSKAPPTGQG